MFTGLLIKNFRGVERGEISDLRPLTILVGPNNSGKSTCLEAIALAVPNRGTEQALVDIVSRRGWFGADGLDYLYYRGDSLLGDPQAGAEFRLAADPAQGESFQAVISGPHSIQTNLIQKARSLGLEEPVLGMSLGQQFGDGTPVVGTTVAVDGKGRAEVVGVTTHERNRRVPKVQLVDVRSLDRFGTLEKLYSEIERSGTLAEVLGYLTAFRGVKDLRIVQNQRDRTFVLHAKERETETSPGGGSARSASIPAYLLGDGFKKYLQILSAFILARGGLVLVEEPEAFQHPRSLRMMAETMVDLSGRTQFILSTHSLELIDMIVEALERRGGAVPSGSESGPSLRDLVLLRMHLDGGRLTAVPVSGEQVRDLRGALEEDLR